MGTMPVAHQNAVDGVARLVQRRVAKIDGCGAISQFVTRHRAIGQLRRYYAPIGKRRRAGTQGTSRRIQCQTGANRNALDAASAATETTQDTTAWEATCLCRRD